MGEWALESLGSLLSDCSDRLAADSGGDGERSIGNGLMELLESVPMFAEGGLFIMVVAEVDDDDDVVDDGGDASNDVLVFLACRRDAVKHRVWIGLINIVLDSQTRRGKRE